MKSSVAIIVSNPDISLMLHLIRLIVLSLSTLLIFKEFTLIKYVLLHQSCDRSKISVGRRRVKCCSAKSCDCVWALSILQAVKELVLATILC